MAEYHDLLVTAHAAIEVSKRDCRQVSSGMIRDVALAIEFAEDEVDRLCKIIRYVAANTRDQWARDYLTNRLSGRGHDASLSNPVETWEDLRAEVEKLKAENAALRELVVDGYYEEFGDVQSEGAQKEVDRFWRKSTTKKRLEQIGKGEG